MEHSERSPLPPIWPEKYEDVYFNLYGDLVDMHIRQKVGSSLNEAMKRVEKGERDVLIELGVDDIEKVVTTRVPPMKDLIEDQERVRANMAVGKMIVEATEQRSKFFQSFGTFDRELIPTKPSEFDMGIIAHFNMLPMIAKWREEYLRNLIKWKIVRTVEEMDASRNELLHTLYHMSYWRANGRRVYVLDQTLYTMLAHTELPAWPLDTLAFKSASFYIKLPRGAFQFGCRNRMGMLDIEDAEGIMVTISDPSPDTGKQRELALIVCGDGSSVKKGSSGSNIAYITVGLGPDGKMSDVVLVKGSDYTEAEQGEDQYLRVTVPRVILGLMLYMQSEHPDLMPVPAAARRNIEAIQNPGKRRKAEKANARQSRLGYIYVGKRLALEQAEIEREASTRAEQSGRKLDHPVWVSGHWKRQAYGEGRAYRRELWIRPYRKGPDFEESLRIRAAKVQPAQHR